MLMKMLEHLVQNNSYVLSSGNGYPNLNLNLKPGQNVQNHNFSNRLLLED